VTVAGDATQFRDAEAWLAAQGVQRETIAVPDAPLGPPPSAREAARIAVEQPAAPVEPVEPAEPDVQADLADQVARAVAYVRRATANTPMSESRVADKLAARDHPEVVVRQALQRCRDEGLVDDPAYARAFAEERLRKGHAPFRVRVDLSRRGIPDPVIDAVLASAEQGDQEAAAFDVARRKAATLGGVEAETAYRRTVAHVTRRGYPEGLARKVAREAVFTARDAERTAGH
jgi:regulatory protein